MSEKPCTACGVVKPLEAFALSSTGKDGHRTACKECQAAEMRKQRQEQSPEERNAAMAAYRAGMRKDKCAVCGEAIEGHGICESCTTAVKALGGTPEALKRAAKAVAYLGGV